MRNNAYRNKMIQTYFLHVFRVKNTITFFSIKFFVSIIHLKRINSCFTSFPQFDEKSNPLFYPYFGEKKDQILKIKITVGENIIAIIKMQNNYGPIQSFIFPILR